VSNNTLWVSASQGCAIVAPGDFTDNNGSTNDDYVLMMGDMVIEGTLPEIEACLERGLVEVRKRSTRKRARA
jgi:hypothetical protein